jgi:hypothetical protein
MRIALSLCLLLLAPIAARAQTPQIDRIDIVEYGIYTTKTDSKQSSADTAAGVLDMVSDIHHAVTTQTIPAQQGVSFGIRYTIIGAPAGAPVPLHMVTVFPPPGLTNPATQQRKAQSEYDTSAVIGTPTYKGYELTNAWEIVPGIWSIQVWSQGRKLAEQKFTVVRQ